MRVCPYCHLQVSEATHAPCDVATTDVPSQSLPKPLTGRFADVEPFARGDVGTLYRARQAQSGYLGVLKLVDAAAAGAGSERARLKRELRKQTTIDHEALARIVDGGEAEGTLWLFREYIDGESLRQWLRRERRLPAPTALAIAAQVALALDELHRQGLLHRDLKPGHILLSPQPEGPPTVRLIDASLAARQATDGVFELKGTPSYMSPEQATGKLLSYRSDLYSLGCVLHEMLAGKPPFEGELPEVLDAHRATLPPPPDVELPDRVTKLLSQLLHKEPRKRPFSAKQVWRTLQAELPAGTPVPERRESRSLPNQHQPGGASAVPPAFASAAPAQRPSMISGPPAAAGDASLPPPTPGANASARPARPNGSVPPPTPRRGARSDATQVLDTQELSRVAIDEVLEETSPRRASRSDATQVLDTQELSRVAIDEAVEGAYDRSDRSDATQMLDTQELSRMAIEEASERANERPDATQRLDGEELSRLSVEPAAPLNGSAPPPIPGSRSSAPKATAPPSQGVSAPPPVPGAAVSRPPDSGADLAAATPPAGSVASRPPVSPGIADPADGLEGGGSAVDSEADSQLEDGQRDARSGEPPSPAEAVETALSAEAEHSATEPDHSAPADGASDGASQPATAAAGVSQDGRERAPSAAPNDARAADPVAAAETEQASEDAPSTVAAGSDVEPRVAVGAAAQAESAAGANTPGDAAAASSRPQVNFDVESLFADEEDAEDGAATIAIDRDAVVQGVAAEGAGDAGVAARVASEPAPTSQADTRSEGDKGAVPWRAIAAGVAVLLLLLWAWSGNDEPEAEVATAAGGATEQTPDREAEAAREAERAAAAARAEAEEAAAAQAEAEAEEAAAARAEAEAEEAAAARAKAEAEEAPARARKPPQAQAARKARARQERARPSGPSKSASAYKDEARAHYRAKRFAKAASAYERATALAPNDAGAFAGLGASRLAAGNVGGAVSAYRRAVQLKPRVSGFQAALGRAYYQAGNRKRAIAAYREAVRLDAGNAAARAALEHLGVKVD